MTTSSSTSDHLFAGTLEGWHNYNGLLTKALAPLTDEQLDLRPAPDLRSVRELAMHIVGTRAGWFHRMLHEGDDEIEALANWGRDGQQRGASEIVAGLDATWRLMADSIARWTPEERAGSVTAERYGQTHTLTRAWVVWHVLEHDLHHGGEMGYTLGMHGVAAPEI